jgi:hypothetical protein
VTAREEAANPNDIVGRRHGWGEARVAVAVGVVVTCLALVRMLPFDLVYEEPVEFWARVPTMDPIAYVFTPWAGYLQTFARTAFLVAYPFGLLGPLVTRLLAAGVIGSLATYLVRATAVPSSGVRIATALALPLLPTGYPGPYIGPLNSQWWIAILVLLIALAPQRRRHYPALLLAGLSGVAPCLALPVFRDRRVAWLLVPAAIQVAVLVSSGRRPLGLAMSLDFLVPAALLVGVMAVSRLPIRTRLGFAYLGLAILTLGSIITGGASGSDRYLAVAWTGIALGVAALLASQMTVREHRRERRDEDSQAKPA